MLEQEDLKKIGEIIEKKFNNVRQEMKDGFDNVNKEFNNVRQEMKEESEKIIQGVCELIEQNILPVIDDVRNESKQEIIKASSMKVTVDYLDERLNNLKGDIVSLIRKEDDKIMIVVKSFQNKNFLDKNEAKEIFKLEPFAKII